MEVRESVAVADNPNNKPVLNVEEFYDLLAPDYDDKGILFSIHTTEKGGAEAKRSEKTIRLRPVVREELVKILSEAGLPHIHVYGGISMEQFDALKSNDLVVLARKSV